MSGVDHDSRHGEVIAGNYVLDRILGVGGMGVVYTALQRSLERVVAVKLPRPELATDPDVRSRLRVEAIAASRITHRNSVRLLDYGSHEGAPYLVMEHVAGPLLGQLLLDHGPLPATMAVRFVRDIASVLEEAHVNGIVHADVKCDNVLVETSRDGNMVPRLIDWGIARFSDDREIRAGQFVTGTPEYVAPEVVVGEPPTYAADVYALGVILYELITGATPFAGSPEIMRRKLDELAVPLAVRCPALDLPEALDSIVMRALAREPMDRFSDAGQLARALEDLDASGELTRRPPAKMSEPVVFSTEATTATMTVVHETRDRDRRTTAPSLDEGDIDAVVIAYLDLARSLVDQHRLDRAIVELEGAIELLSIPSQRAPVWRLLLTLAALYDGVGDRTRARGAARRAREWALRDGSSIGCERAERLARRLSRSSSARRARPW